jgi:AcrR family transcriptional regulator
MATTGGARAERRAATAAKILQAAQDEFGELGAEGATIRGIARRAGVDPSLVLQHYGSKQSLFALAVAPVAELASGAVPEHLAEVMGARLRELPPPTRALLRSMLTSDEAAAVMRGYLEERAAVLAEAIEGDDAELRAAVLVASILGMTLARHLLQLPGLADLDEERAAAVIDPWLASLVGR